MNQLACIVGPTATSKTAYAIDLSQKSPSIIVSADSRQVYRGMDIVTGKDHGKDVTIYGVDIVDPDDDCSVAVWYDAVIPTIKSAWREGKQVILVGGTGLYVKAITNGIETMQIPINNNLREELSLLTVAQLQEKLQTLNPSKLNSLNQSDINNPRRLIRAIEIYKDPFFVKQRTDLIETTTTIIGRRYLNSKAYESAIRARVLSRLELGAIAETEVLLKKYDQNLPSMSAIGYRSITRYLSGEIDQASMIEDWVAGELGYAKRQLTWFNKVKRIQWYDIDN